MVKSKIILQAIAYPGCDHQNHNRPVKGCLTVISLLREEVCWTV